MAENLKNQIIKIIEFNTEDDCEITEDTQLIGATGILDSIGFVGTMVDMQDAFPGIDFTNDKAMSAATSPFRTLGTLIDYVNEHSDNRSK